MIFLQCVFCTLLCYFVGVYAAQECQTRPPTDHKRLMHDLFCNYDKTAVPKKAENTNTDIRVTFLLKEFYFYSYTDELDVQVFSLLAWLDKKLSWDQSSYGGISTINVDSNLIWMPELAVEHPRDRTKEGEVSLHGASCVLLNIGFVQCTVSSRFSAPCTADITRWPYDSQSCKILIKPWTRSSDDVELVVWSRNRNYSMVFDDIYTPSKEWSLQKAKIQQTTASFRKNSTYTYLEMIMEIKRHGNLFEAVMVVPGIVIAIATLTSFWMHYEINIRFCVCSLAIVMDTLYLQYLGYSLHENGASCPLIVLFYRDHLLTSAAALLITFVVCWMHGTEMEVPVLATSIVHPIVNSRSASWLLLAEPVTDPVKEKKQQWQPLAVLLDRVAFVAFSVTFLVLHLICF